MKLRATLSFAIIGLISSAASAGMRTCPDTGSDAYYFAKGSIDSRSGSDQFVREWYSRQLRAMNEPSLSCGPTVAAQVYRFTWLRTFRHPIVVRVTQSAEGARLEAVELDGAGGYEPGKVLNRVSYNINSADWHALEDQFSAVLQLEKADELGLDGAEWIFEGRKGEDYTYIKFWSPSAGPSWNLGMYLIELSSLNVPQDSRY